MNWDQLWTNYTELVVIVATALVTLIATKVLPWIWKYVVVWAWTLMATRVSRRWRARCFRKQYLSWLIEEHRFLEIQGLRTRSPVSIQLEETYVPLKARVKSQTDLTPKQMLTSSSDREQEIVSVIRSLAERNRVVILGDPGSGKTTLLRFLAVTFGRLQRHDRSEGDDVKALEKRLYPDWPLNRGILTLQRREKTPLPLFISLRSVTPESLGNKLEDLFIGRYLQASCPEEFLEASLQDGQCIVLLDGLDEVRGLDERRQVVEWIEDLVASYPENRYVVTSRIVGYSTPVSRGFATLVLDDFSDQDITHFVTKWYHTVEEIGKGKGLHVGRHAQRQAEALVQAINENDQLKRLAVNPLLLSIIALVHRYRARLPDRRVDLYDECTLALLGHWDQAKGLAGRLPPTQKRLILEPIAWRMQLDKSHDLDRPVVESILESELPKVGGTREDAKEFLDEIRERSGLLIERGPDVFAFSHLTFQEYLAARQVSKTDQLMLLLDRTSDDQWQEVILLCCGMQDATGFVSALMERPDDMFQSNLLLAGQCVAEALSIDQELRHRLVASLHELVIGSNFQACRRAVAKVLRGLAPHSTAERLQSLSTADASPQRSRAIEAIAGFIDFLPETFHLELLRHSEEEICTQAMIAVSMRSELTPALLEGIVKRLNDENPDIRRMAASALHATPYPPALEPLVDRLLCDENPSVREATAVALGAYPHPNLLAYVGLAISDAQAEVVIEAYNSASRVLYGLSRRKQFRFLFDSSLKLVQEFLTKAHRDEAMLAVAAGVGSVLGVVSLIPGYILKLYARDGWIAQGLRVVYRAWFWLIASLSRPLLTWMLSSRDEARMWTSLFRSMMAYSAGDPRAVLPIRYLLTSVNSKYQTMALLHAAVAKAEAHLVEDCLRQAFVEAQSQHLAQTAAVTLARVNPQLALDTFSVQTRSASSPQLRSVALNSLLLLQDQLETSHKITIQQDLTSESPVVREAACSVLGQLKDRSSIPLIHALLQDESASVRTKACEALAQVGSAASIQCLMPLLVDDDEAVRDAAYDALWQICRQSAVNLSSVG